jgi:hypothetical protein
MKNNITLYNHFHNGDIFYSRILVNILKNHYNITYYHNLQSPLFEDLPEVNEIVGIPSNYDINNTNLENNIVNTWIGQKQMIYVSHQPIPGCSFTNHFKLVTDICNFYNIKLENDFNNYLPSVNNDNLKSYNNIVEKIKKLKLKYDLIILVCDGNVNSNQSHNFNFIPIVEHLSKNNPNCLFLSTNQLYENKPNVITTYPQITESLPDLLQISLISNHCDIIVGRASGPFCFTHTKENFNDDKKTFISFTFNESEGIFYYDGKNKSLWSNNLNYPNMITTIQNEINLKLKQL